jgi:hypothetical protein
MGRPTRAGRGSKGAIWRQVVSGRVQGQAQRESSPRQGSALRVAKRDAAAGDSAWQWPDAIAASVTSGAGAGASSVPLLQLGSGAGVPAG